MTKIYNKSTEKQKRKELRNQMPLAEVVLWSRIRKRGISGFKFRRQYGVGPYVVDFYCPELKLAIELDGDSHFQEGAEEYDGNRQQTIEQLGIRFLRFTNRDVYKNLNAVLEAIAESAGRMKKEPGRKSGENTPSA